MQIKGHTDFIMNSDIFHNLFTFDWGEHAFSILFENLPQIAEALNDRSEFALGMTKHKFGYEEVDTTPFREAIHMYLMSIFGIKDDAYLYGKINKVLQYQHKVYIKKMMCGPQSITQHDFQGLTKLLPEERAHIGLIVMETKNRVELIHATKIISLFLNL